ncbi:MAG: GvpL/GvpF family gas vesicle protein [Chloroflexota bacterium]
MRFYLYGIIPAGQPLPRIAGVEDGDLLACAGGAGTRLAATYSPLQGAPSATPQHLRQHHRVTMALLRRGPLIPFRFGAVLAGEEAVQGLLQERGEEFADRLENLRGRVELSVKLLLSEPLESPAGDVERWGQPGTSYLRRKARLARRSELRAADLDLLSEHLHHVMSGLVIDWRGEQRGAMRSLAWLVRSGDVQSFKARLAAFGRARPEVKILSSGPWPAYSFV